MGYDCIEGFLYKQGVRGVEREQSLELPVVQVGPAPPDPAALQKVFHALANEHRLHIFQRLAAGNLGTCCGRIEWFEKGCCVTDLVNLIGLSQPTISHHLSVLQEAGLVRSEKRGLWTVFFPDPAAAELLSRFVGGLRDSLDCCRPEPSVPADARE